MNEHEGRAASKTVLFITLALASRGYAMMDHANIANPNVLSGIPLPQCTLSVAGPIQVLVDPNTGAGVPTCTQVTLTTSTVPPTTPPPDWIGISTISEATNKLPPQSFNGSPGGTMNVCSSQPETFVIRGTVAGMGAPASPATPCLNTIPITTQWAPPPTCTAWANPGSVMTFCGFMLSNPTIGFNPNGRGGPITSADVDGWPINPYGGQTGIAMPFGTSSQTFTVHLNGPGGSTSCAVNVGTYCLPQVPFQVPDVLVPGTLATYIPFNNPPWCLWTKIGGNASDSILIRGCMPGCFAPETKMRMADGSLKEASLVAAGDYLWNPILKKPVAVARVIVGPEALRLVELGLGDHTLRVSAKHPMLTPDGLQRADALKPGMQVQTSDGRFRRLRTVRRPPRAPKQFVYNFALAVGSNEVREHLLEGNGIVTGDFVLQVGLEMSAR